MAGETESIYGLWSDESEKKGSSGWWCDNQGLVFTTPYFSVALAQLDLVENFIQSFCGPWQIRDINRWAEGLELLEGRMGKIILSSCGTPEQAQEGLEQVWRAISEGRDPEAGSENWCRFMKRAFPDVPCEKLCPILTVFGHKFCGEAMPEYWIWDDLSFRVAAIVAGHETGSLESARASAANAAKAVLDSYISHREALIAEGYRILRENKDGYGD